MNDDDESEKQYQKMVRKRKKGERLLIKLNYRDAHAKCCLTCGNGSQLSCEDPITCKIAENVDVNDTCVCDDWISPTKL